MIDPLAEVVTLLQPTARFSKVVQAAGRWRASRSNLGEPFYCAVLEGGSRLEIAEGTSGNRSIELQAGDFVLIPAAYDFTVSSLEPTTAADAITIHTALPGGEFRVGRQDGPRDFRAMVGHCSFNSPDAGLLVALLPKYVHVRGESRLSILVQLLRDESRANRPAREVVLSRLLELLFIEAFRSVGGETDGTSGSNESNNSACCNAGAPGLLRGLTDVRLAAAIRRIHEKPAHAWTIALMAKEAALSRSAFFDRFSRALGVPPMEYLLAWRMALAKASLRRAECTIAELAQRVGYSSASTFSVAFTRYVGQPPSHYAREHMGDGSSESDAVENGPELVPAI